MMAQAKSVFVSERAVQELLASLQDVAMNNGVGNGKEGMLMLLGMAAGQFTAEIEIEERRDAREVADDLMQAVRAGIHHARNVTGAGTSMLRPGEKIH